MTKNDSPLPTGNNGDSFSTGGSLVLGEMPDPKPLFVKFLTWALELGIVTYVMLVKAIPPLKILELLKDDAMARSLIYSACTRMAEKFAIKLGFDRQVEDVDMAIETDDEVAERFVLAVGIAFIVEHIPLKKIFLFVMETRWDHDSTSPENRELAARLCDALVEHKAWNGSVTATYERIVDAITLEELFGDMVPAGLRVRAASTLRRYAKQTGLRNIGAVIFDPEDGISFTKLAQHLEVRVMAEPFSLYANAIGLLEESVVAEIVPQAEMLPAPKEVVIDFADEDVDDVEALFAEEDDEDDHTQVISPDVAQALAELKEGEGAPPPLPRRKR